ELENTVVLRHVEELRARRAALLARVRQRQIVDEDLRAEVFLRAQLLEERRLDTDEVEAFDQRCSLLEKATPLGCARGLDARDVAYVDDDRTFETVDELVARERVVEVAREAQIDKAPVDDLVDADLRVDLADAIVELRCEEVDDLGL